MNIRAVEEDDISEIANLVSSLSHFYLENEKNELPNWFAQTLTEKAFAARVQSEQYQNFIYRLDGHLAGYLAFKGNSHLYHLFVDEKHQGKGIAHGLWRYAIKQCVAEVYTLRSSLFAIPVYQRFGFEIIGEAQEKDGIGFQTMELRL